jgi:hypothetical protein
MQQQDGECSLSFHSLAPSASKDSRSRSILWRAAVVDAVTEATGQLASTNTVTYTERDNERWAISAAERKGDDAALMGYLKKYCPTDPHVERYPGAACRTE